MAKGAFRAAAIFQSFATAHSMLEKAIGEYNQFDSGKSRKGERNGESGGARGGFGGQHGGKARGGKGRIQCHTSAHAHYDTQSAWGTKSLLLRRLLKVKWGKQSQRLLREQLRSRSPPPA
jgi:hypothetical protein